MDGISSAAQRIDCFIPAAADTEIETGRDKVNDFPVLRSKLFHYCPGAVCAMIINDNNIVIKIRLLAQSAFNCGGDCFFSVENGNYHTGGQRIINFIRR